MFCTLRRTLFSKLITLLLLTTLFGAPAGAQQQSAETAEAERARIETIVRDYLLNNPELIIEVMRRLEEKQQAEKDQAFKTNLVMVRSELFDNPDAPAMGNADGKTVIVEFSDYNCPYCKRMAPTVKQAMESEPDLKVVMIEFPILGPNSQYAAAAALAAKLQGKYSEAHFALFGQKGSLAPASIDRALQRAGLNLKKLKQDMKRPEIQQALERNLELGQLLGINGTPAFIGGDLLRPGAIPASEFVKLIEAARPAE